MPTIDKRYVILSSTLNQDYAFYMPIIGSMWIELNYTPIMCLVGTEEEWNSHTYGKIALNEASTSYTNIEFITKLSQCRESTIAQTVRLAGGSIHTTNDDDYILTADMDMLPLSRTYFNNPLQNNAAVDLYFANAYAGETTPHWPLCYIGMTKIYWYDLLGKYENPTEAVANFLKGTENLDHGSAWNFDEYYVSAAIQKKIDSGWPVNKIHRKTGFAGGPYDRIDRVCWESSRRHINDGLVDCHSLRPGFFPENWPRVKNLLNEFKTGLGDSYQSYRDEFFNSRDWSNY